MLIMRKGGASLPFFIYRGKAHVRMARALLAKAALRTTRLAIPQDICYTVFVVIETTKQEKCHDYL